jgi:hypothetical protein
VVQLIVYFLLNSAFSPKEKKRKCAKKRKEKLQVKGFCESRMGTYNWKGQSYESLEALRTHLLYFEWDIVEAFKKDGTTGNENADAALSLKVVPGTEPKPGKGKNPLDGKL